MLTERKVTIIDDEKGLVDTLKSLLEPRGFLVVTAYNGVTGLELIKREKPDLIILDIMMPGMDGRDVIIKLKKEDDTKNIPVIFLTGKAEPFEKDYGLELGAYEYFAKPYRLTKLLDRISEILDRRK